MSIRTNANVKDHLAEKGSILTLVAKPDAPETLDPLKFWTAHPKKPCFVDLTVFADGQLESRGTKWKGAFAGHRDLIVEMAPALQDHLAPLAAASVAQYMNALRAWWRLFDSIEAEMPMATPLSSTTQLTELHRQRAFDQGMDRLCFGNFLLVANKTRVALGVPPLLWQRPDHRTKTRHLPPQWQTDLIRHELKHRWFATVDRWELAAELVRTGEPLACATNDPIVYGEQARLLEGYKRLESALSRTGAARPETVDELFDEKSRDDFYKKYKLTLTDTLRGRYPDANDIRAAFHLCLATTGWNVQVLLDLDVTESILEPHPKDPTRYILRGHKDRAGGAEQLTEGLFKTRGGAGYVIQRLIAQTTPLRNQLRQELEECKKQLKRAATHELREQVQALEEGVRSVWLYSTLHGILWLHRKSYDGAEFLPSVVADINERQAPNRQVSVITASDLRDAFAARVYHASGGSILAVMRALNHKRLSSTRDYLDNTLLREEHRKLYLTFSDALWQEIKLFRRVDPTVLAMWSRHGNVTDEHRERLTDYRDLLRSRIDVGCKDPLNPPKRIAPQFRSDGATLCPVQRCLLCFEHAVILPDSLGGLCKRLAELRYLRAHMSTTAYTQSSFSEETQNIELALLGFDSSVVQATIDDWERRIADGTHRVIEFEGAEE
ncbi:hypothetical protein [Burkholderia cenocepacia]|uniref:hypothetical protein n=1 Tax=Burkholderia cenocepacia TaxID=95486 RepID=UPI00396B218F